MKKLILIIFLFVSSLAFGALEKRKAGSSGKIFAAKKGRSQRHHSVEEVVLARFFDSRLLKAKKLFRSCLFGAPNKKEVAVGVPADSVRIKFESSGSGAVLLPPLTAKKNMTLGELREKINYFILASIDGHQSFIKKFIEKNNNRRPSQVERIFLGYGGRELSDNSKTLEELGIETGAVLVLLKKKHLDLSYTYLGGVNLRAADLRGADLRGSCLIGVDFIKADLRGAKFTSTRTVFLSEEVDLIGPLLTACSLRGADLRSADLRVADLRGADLRGADLTGADLTGADLTGADLRGADLTNTNLSEAVLIDSLLEGANLRNANFSDSYASFDQVSLALNVTEEQRVGILF